MIHRVAPVMAGAILDVHDQILGFSQLTENCPDDLQIGLLAVAADIVYLAGRTLQQHGLDRAAVIHHVQPVPDL